MNGGIYEGPSGQLLHGDGKPIGTPASHNSELAPAAGSAPLPSVAGRMEMTHADFQRACQVELGRLQEDHLCDNRLVYLLCEAVRCSRECCDLATRNLRVPNDQDQP